MTMGDNAATTPSLKRPYTHWSCADISPGTSASSSSSSVILPHRDGPALQQPTRHEMLAALGDDTEAGVRHFIDDIAMSEAI